MLTYPALGRPEIQLLHSAARLHLSEPEADRLAALLAVPSLEWAFILEMAARHGLSALLHRHLERPRFRLHLPLPVRTRLQQQAACVHQRNLALTGALVEAMQRLDDEGV